MSLGCAAPGSFLEAEYMDDLSAAWIFYQDCSNIFPKLWRKSREALREDHLDLTLLDLRPDHLMAVGASRCNQARRALFRLARFLHGVEEAGRSVDHMLSEGASVMLMMQSVHDVCSCSHEAAALRDETFFETSFETGPAAALGRVEVADLSSLALLRVLPARPAPAAAPVEFRRSRCSFMLCSKTRPRTRASRSACGWPLPCWRSPALLAFAASRF